MYWLYTSLTLLLLLTSIWIAWQDFKSREVSVLSLLLFTGFILTGAVLRQPFVLLLINAAASLLFLAFQALAVFLYFFVRNRLRSEKTAMSGLIGGADIWMMLALAFAFNWMALVFVITASTIVALLAFLIIKATGRMKDERIPLAGVFAIAYILMELFFLWMPQLNRYYPLTIQ